MSSLETRLEAPAERLSTEQVMDMFAENTANMFAKSLDELPDVQTVEAEMAGQDSFEIAEQIRAATIAAQRQAEDEAPPPPLPPQAEIAEEGKAFRFDDPQKADKVKMSGHIKGVATNNLTLGGMTEEEYKAEKERVKQTIRQFVAAENLFDDLQDLQEDLANLFKRREGLLKERDDLDKVILTQRSGVAQQEAVVADKAAEVEDAAGDAESSNQAVIDGREEIRAAEEAKKAADEGVESAENAVNSSLSPEEAIRNLALLDEARLTAAQQAEVVKFLKLRQAPLEAKRVEDQDRLATLREELRLEEEKLLQLKEELEASEDKRVELTDQIETVESDIVAKKLQIKEVEEKINDSSQKIDTDDIHINHFLEDRQAVLVDYYKQYGETRAAEESLALAKGQLDQADENLDAAIKDSEDTFSADENIPDSGFSFNPQDFIDGIYNMYDNFLNDMGFNENNALTLQEKEMTIFEKAAGQEANGISVLGYTEDEFILNDFMRDLRDGNSPEIPQVLKDIVAQSPDYKDHNINTLTHEDFSNIIMKRFPDGKIGASVLMPGSLRDWAKEQQDRIHPQSATEVSTEEKFGANAAEITAPMSKGTPLSLNDDIAPAEVSTFGSSNADGSDLEVSSLQGSWVAAVTNTPSGESTIPNMSIAPPDSPIYKQSSAALRASAP